MSHTYDYPRPAVTVDSVIFTLTNDGLAVLLIRRKKAPFRGKWALPGGFVDPHETLEHAAERELEEETALSGVHLEQLQAYGDPGRDPRGHTVSVAFTAFVVAEAHVVRAGDDATQAAWVALRDGDRENLAFDHARIIDDARAWLRKQLDDPRQCAHFELVPPRFTLTELQRVYEAVFERAIDKRNFRARLFALGLVEPVSSAHRTGRHRPAQLYRWKTPRRPPNRAV